MNAADVAQRLRAAAEGVFAGEGVVAAYLFGSFARHEEHARSDVDVAVLFDDGQHPAGTVDRSLRLAGLLERAAGLGPVEVVVLNGVPLPLAGRVLRDGVVIFGRDDPRRVRYESETVRAFLDFDLHARRLDAAFLHATAEGRR